MSINIHTHMCQHAYAPIKVLMYTWQKYSKSYLQGPNTAHADTYTVHADTYITYTDTYIAHTETVDVDFTFLAHSVDAPDRLVF